MQLFNTFAKRKIYNREDTIKKENTILFENALNSIDKTSRLSRPLAEEYFINCNTHENANKYNFNLIQLLEEVSLKEKSSLYNKLEGMYIENIIPRLTNTNIKATINIVESSDILKNTPILDTLKNYVVCDRIIENYNKIDNKFNIDKSIIDAKDGIECIYEICEDIDKYNISKASKYNIALETISYGFYKNGLEYSVESILENTTDYFLSDMNISDYDYSSMQKVLTYNPFITEESKERVRYFIQEDGDTYKKELKKLLSDKKLSKEEYKLLKELYDAKDIKESKSVVRKILKLILGVYIGIGTVTYVIGGGVALAIGGVFTLLYGVFLAGGIFAYEALDIIIRGIEKATKKTLNYSKDKVDKVIKKCKELKKNNNAVLNESEEFADSDDEKTLLNKYKAQQ